MMILQFDCMAHADDVVADACNKHPQPFGSGHAHCFIPFVCSVFHQLHNATHHPTPVSMHSSRFQAKKGARHCSW
jgi:hypothetical protein